MSSAQRLRAIIRNGATVLLCTPTYALRMAEVARDEGIDLKDAAVQKIFVAGEPGGTVPQVRDPISAVWNHARVLDHYGMTEVGPVSFEELDEPGVQRINEESYFAEIVEPDSGRPAADGEVGELVLTTLGREASPLLRYRTGDLVKARREENGLVLEGGIIGRADDMVVVRGVNLYPSALDAVVRAVPEITEYRAEISRRGEMTELIIRVESSDGGAASTLEKALSAAFALRIPVICAPAGSLPRFELKARRWVRNE